MNDRMHVRWEKLLEKYLPAHINMALSRMEEKISLGAEEIRLRAGRPLMVYTCDGGYCIGRDGAAREDGGITVSEEDVEQTFNAITGKSAYAHEEEISQGFLTLESGIRAGLAGTAVLADAAGAYKHIGGINFRIPREVFGIAETLLPYISRQRRLVNTLVLSAPKLGKTTLVRDIARCAGSGIGLAPCKVSLIDERQELAACLGASPMFDVGRETDVISGVVKHAGVFLALRSLSPDVVITDELGKSEDLEALREVGNSGVVMVTTAHAPDFRSLLSRFFFRKIFEERLFDAYVVLTAALGRITVGQVHDSAGRGLLDTPVLLRGRS